MPSASTPGYSPECICFPREEKRYIRETNLVISLIDSSSIFTLKLILTLILTLQQQPLTANSTTNSYHQVYHLYHLKMKFMTVLAATALATVVSADPGYEGWLWYAKAGKCSGEGESDPNQLIDYPPEDGGKFCQKVSYSSDDYGLVLDMTNIGGYFAPKYVKGCSDSDCTQCGDAADITVEDTGIRMDCKQFTNAPYVYIY